MVSVNQPGQATPTGRTVADRAPRWTMLAGIAFAVTFVVGMILGRDTPDYDESDAAWTEWFDDGGHRAQQIVSLFLLTIAALAFVVFIVGLVRVVRSQALAVHSAAQVAGGAGLILAASIAFGGVAINQMSAAIEFGDLPLPSAELLRTAEQLGFGLLLVSGGLFAALTVASVSVAARRTAALPQWLVTAGFVCAVILLFGVLFIPMAVLPLWALAVSITVGRRPMG
jgi:hypothetical protein